MGDNMMQQDADRSGLMRLGTNPAVPAASSLLLLREFLVIIALHGCRASRIAARCKRIQEKLAAVRQGDAAGGSIST